METKMFQYKCYKCSKDFESDNEEDEYSFCTLCLEDHKKFIAELDKKIKPIPTPKKELRWIPANVPGGKLYLDV